ncbi:excisionase family DNA-binding protein [Caballeronia sp. LP006]|uniref:GAF domain-containing protein n=1 Tax=Caballeronia sp. LP006 TaxID=3038552 RepID=UPI00285A580B|nr:GAF domain-containing protein [Caballeronia sp. LP006]MDR5826358.1 excisionase family DNA-binding protein [Caballeronia sp. LP006]
MQTVDAHGTERRFIFARFSLPAYGCMFAELSLSSAARALSNVIDMESDPILTTREAAEILGVSIRTVQTWVEEGAIDSWKTPGGHRRVRRSAVFALRERRLVAPVQTAYTVLIIASEGAGRRCSESLASVPAVQVSVANDALLGLIEAGHQMPASVVMEIDRLDWERIALLKRLLASPRLAHSNIVVLSDLNAEELRFDLGDTRMRLVSKRAAPEQLRAAIAPYLEAVADIAAARELARLQAVARTNLVNSPQQEEFDEIVALAANVAKVPIALITLLTAKEQWFKARYGLATQETPRDYAFCNYTIAQPDGLIVEDAAEDVRFRANPLVTGDMGIRFYAGASIIDYEGYALGALCVIDRAPRAFKAPQMAMLRTLAALVSDKINLQTRNRQLRKAKG